MEPIAIIGIGCRFPGAENPESFWNLLRSGGDAITEVPSDRWDIDAFYDPNPGIPGKMSTRWGGFLNQVDQFDPGFFGILPRRAKLIDPQHRLVLEVAWEALEDAGVVPAKLAGSKTGVFIAISHNDYDRIICKDISRVNAHHGPSTYHCIAANRLSHVLDLRGPSMAVDTACSSSLVAVHLACQSLRTGESQMALVGGVSLILSPEETIASSHARVMAPDGRCKTFDASTNGYVRGEGCGVVVLKRLADAVRDKDNVLAVIKGSAVNQNGLGNGLTAFNGPAQQAVISQALENAEVAPAEISYVEVHGTGTPLGDPIEANALKTVLMRDRSPDQPCWIGSVKTNIGYLESASAMASLIKVVLSLKHQEIPAHLHLKNLNPRISLTGTPISIPTECQPWPVDTAPRRAGISAFGFGGTNSHLILEEAPVLPTAISDNKRPVHLLTLSAKSEKALRELATRYETYLQSHTEAALEDVCFTANAGRSHFPYRLAVVTQSTTQLREQLSAFIAGREAVGLASSQGQTPKSRKIAFLFSGQNSEYVNIGRQLYRTQLVFRRTLDRCDEILRPYLEKSLLEVLYPVSGQTSSLSENIYNQPALFALEYALAKLWQSWGIKPSSVMGYAVGEYVAACIAGVFSLEDGLKLITARAGLMHIPLAQVAATIESAVNGCKSATATLPTLTSETRYTFEQIAQAVTYSTPSIDLVSSLTGKLVTDEIATPDYWLNHLQQSERFASGLEIGSEPEIEENGQYGSSDDLELQLPGLCQGQSDWQQTLESLRELYLLGASVDWSNFDRDYPYRRLQLPTYPFQRQRCWIEATDSATELSR
ncbi:type I polyketide synthase [Nostoc sp. MG11]|uniref:type I polyketide synthase n=1 Tax=Nostoc sp. MG11 TaxID=2721166 RepID=UPI00186682A7|nr:type I polyketide synthase [Nostoc sp. MG11]